jgi:hypothetical protein
MRFVHWALLPVIILTLLSGTAQAFSPDWFACQSDSDCVQVAEGCACGKQNRSTNLLAVNKKYKDDYSQSAQALCTVNEPPFYMSSPKALERGCDLAFSSPDDDRAQVKCVKNLCGSYPSRD